MADERASEPADMGLAEHFMRDHRACDSRWAEVEGAVDAGDVEQVTRVWGRYDRALRRHLDMEEQLLFPAFEAVTSMPDGGPTQVMRSEHAQMRGLLDQMAAAAERGECDELLDLGDTLHMLIQQHNTKEEGVLYPMAEQALGPDWADLRKKLLAFGSADS